MTTSQRFLLSFAIIAIAAGISPQHLFAAEQTGTISVEQQSPNGIFGEWILIKPGNKRLTLRQESYTLEEAPLGNYTLLVEPPSGAITTVRVFIDQDMLKSFSQPQASFTLEQNTHIRLRVEYTFTRVGTVGVNSQPPGMGFTLIGPNDFEITGKTPASYSAMPEGQYTVTFDKIEGCPLPKPKSDRLIAGSRINFSITFSCEGLKYFNPQEEYERSLQYVTSTINGVQITFDDVPIDQWFAPFVHTSLKSGIMSGYQDEAGNPTGKYGPGDNVTIAQLAKIAHKLAGIDETETYTPSKNPRAENTWFSQYFASAENLDWQVFRDHRIDPERPATRGEVVATLLQALDVRRFWAHGDLFRDVRKTTPYASCIETAAQDGIVSGFTDAEGKPTGEFGPDRPVNRAEMSKIISTSADLYIETDAS